MRYLIGTDLSVDEITQWCGYEDPRSFGRMFREQTGLSSHEYRHRFNHLHRAWR
jgi:transcriptional regulator GlxA family with amidase domain